MLQKSVVTGVITQKFIGGNVVIILPIDFVPFASPTQMFRRSAVTSASEWDEVSQLR